MFTTTRALWNTPLAKMSLDQFVTSERVPGVNLKATVSGRVFDATARYNLTNLTDGSSVEAANVAIYERLLANLRLDSALALRTAQAMSATPAARATRANAQTFAASRVTRINEPLQLTALDDLLLIPGYTVEAIDRLREFAIVLPRPTPVNVNTAKPEVISALVENFSVAQATALVARREQAYYRSNANFREQLYGARVLLARSIDVKSEYFLVQTHIRLDRAYLNSESLVNRRLDEIVSTRTIWIRHR